MVFPTEHSTLESNGRQPGVFFFQDDVQLPSEPKDPDFDLHIYSEKKVFAVKTVKFECHDQSTPKCLSLCAVRKMWNWTFNMGLLQQEWEVKVGQSCVGPKTLQFTIDGKEIFSNHLKEDFEYNLLVHSTLNLSKQYEVKSTDSTDQWYPATLTARGDGKYKAQVRRKDESGNEMEVNYPIVEVNFIRDPFTKNIIEVPSNKLRLHVKKDDVRVPKLTINDESFQSYISVPTPAVNKPPAEIHLTVNKDRTKVTADVSHEKLNEALDATRWGYKIRSKVCQMTKLRCQWEIHIGAYGEHCIVAETTSTSSKEINVSIDGNLVVSGAADDLGGKKWCADIAFQGNLVLQYKLHKTSSNGVATDETTTVTEQTFHSNSITINCPDHRNLESATLECDGVSFSQLEKHEASTSEHMIYDDILAFESAYGVSVPYEFEQIHDLADLDDTDPGAGTTLGAIIETRACNFVFPTRLFSSCFSQKDSQEQSQYTFNCFHSDGQVNIKPSIVDQVNSTDAKVRLPKIPSFATIKSEEVDLFGKLHVDKKEKQQETAQKQFQWQWPESKEAKIQQIKDVISEFRSAAKLGISCRVYNAVGACTRASFGALFVNERATAMKLSMRGIDNKFCEWPSLADIHVFDYSNLQEHSPANKMLKVVESEEKKQSVFLVSNEETLCVVVNDEVIAFKTTLALQILSDFARTERSSWNKDIRKKEQEQQDLQDARTNLEKDGQWEDAPSTLQLHDVVQIKKAFITSDSDFGIKLQKGLRGQVVEVDDEQDALVFFPNLNGVSCLQRWIEQENFSKIAVRK